MYFFRLLWFFNNFLIMLYLLYQLLAVPCGIGQKNHQVETDYTILPIPTPIIHNFVSEMLVRRDIMMAEKIFGKKIQWRKSIIEGKKSRPNIHRRIIVDDIKRNSAQSLLLFVSSYSYCYRTHCYYSVFILGTQPANYSSVFVKQV